MDKAHPLRIERKALYQATRDAYSPDDFPGSKRWLACLAAEQALREFDVAHPEVLASIKAEKAAAPPPDYVTDPNSHYNRALRGED